LFFITFMTLSEYDFNNSTEMQPDSDLRRCFSLRSIWKAVAFPQYVQYKLSSKNLRSSGL